MSLQVGIPLFILAAILQSTLLPRLSVFGGQPDLVVIVVLTWATLSRDQEGMVWAFVGGLFLDLLSGTLLGLSSLVLVPIAYLVGLTEAQVYRNSALLPLLLMAVGSLVYHLAYLLLLHLLTGYPVAWATSLWYVMLPSAFLNTALALPVLRLLTRWYDRLHPRRIVL